MSHTKKRYRLRIGDKLWIHTQGRTVSVPWREAPTDSNRSDSDGEQSGSLVAPMPALVREVHCAVNDAVKKGDTLAVLEAMKMEYPLNAPFDGTVANVNTKADEQVELGELLIEVKPNG